MKKVYVSGRAKHRVKEIAKVHDILKKAGYKIAYDWPSKNHEIKKPYRTLSSRKYNTTAIINMLNAAANSDVFILFDDPGLRGVYIEYGAFLKSALDDPRGKKVYVVGPNSYEREHVFESPEFVKFCDTIEEVYEDLDVE